MDKKSTESVSRRHFLKTAGATALAAGGPAVIIPGRAQPKTLKILKHKSFSSPWGVWFKEFAEAWGQQNDTRVIIDEVGWMDLRNNSVPAEAAAQRGHDLVWFWGLPGLYEDAVIDHRDVYNECVLRYGKPHRVVELWTRTPRKKKLIGMPTTHGPILILYRKDLWDAIGSVPDTWEDIRQGGRKIKFFHGTPIGMALASIIAELSLRAILYSFGGSVQNSEDNPALKSSETLEAIKFVKALYEEAMTEQVLTWELFSDNQAMLAGDISLTMNVGINILRTGENKKLPVADKIYPAKAPQGPAARLTLDGIESFFIWKFAENIEGAKQFIIDYSGEGRSQFLTADKRGHPVFPDTVPDLAQQFANDAKANPPDKYRVLMDVDSWVTSLGHPGHYNVAIQEIFSMDLISQMFASAASGKMTPEEALTQADQEVRKIFDKWRALGKV